MKAVARTEIKSLYGTVRRADGSETTYLLSGGNWLERMIDKVRIKLDNRKARRRIRDEQIQR